MQYKETLHWILDKDCRFLSPGRQTLEEQVALYQQNIDFVHALGLKCDCVGWCKITLDRPDIGELFAKIEDFCQRESWGVRAIYDLEFTGESGWFALNAVDFKENASANRFDVPARDGGEVRLERIKAYADLTPGPREIPNFVAVPERFRQVCMEHSIPCDFFWVEDRGKWHGTQYFCVVPVHSVPRATLQDGNDPEMFEKLGGMLPRVRDLCYEIQQVNLPQIYLADHLPESGVVCACVFDPRYGNWLQPKILVHRDTAELLIKGKALSWKHLSHVPVAEEFPVGYLVRETTPLRLPTEDYIEKGMAQFEELKKNPRPVRLVSEKDALRLLCAAKKDRKADFTKGLTKLVSESPLLPYWKVAGSGWLSDEYELLSPARSEARTAEFHASMAAEELLEVKPAGTVIAICPDGDNCLLTPAWTVERWSHEAPEITEAWPTLPQFFADALCD